VYWKLNALVVLLESDIDTHRHKIYKQKATKPNETKKV